MPLDELPDAERTCENCERHAWLDCNRSPELESLLGVCRDWTEAQCSTRERAEKKIAELESLLLAALCQGAHVDTDGYIDTCHLSTWDEIAEYLEERGKLVRTEHGYRMVGE